ncbi:hypothetical protein [Salmonella enterica]|uniref:hypothetical protein n=1 Tax=Salmonella enterica TaxID=28901 RepID=UPI003966EE2D|nr:hypothetical protein [Salmonella enterica]
MQSCILPCLRFVFPAPAGINRYPNIFRYQLHRVPRASGDKPDRVVPVGHVALCSPRQRG